MLYWKAVHIIAVISWMAGLLYLYRLFVYHNEETVDVVKERLATMEERLFKFIATPACALALISGVAMVLGKPSYFMKAGWFHAKLLAVMVLIILHFAALTVRKKLIAEKHPYKNWKLRFLNEVPTLLMVVIVLLAVLKPL